MPSVLTYGSAMISVCLFIQLSPYETRPLQPTDTCQPADDVITIILQQSERNRRSPLQPISRYRSPTRQDSHLAAAANGSSTAIPRAAGRPRDRRRVRRAPPRPRHGDRGASRGDAMLLLLALEIESGDNLTAPSVMGSRQRI